MDMEELKKLSSSELRSFAENIEKIVYGRMVKSKIDIENARVAGEIPPEELAEMIEKHNEEYAQNYIKMPEDYIYDPIQ